jgi:transcriptional regulator with GAF, ATPase, and Fis domain
MPQQPLYDRILALIGSVFEAYTVVLFLPEQEGTYRLAASFSLGDNVLSNCRLEQGKGLVGWVLRRNRPILVNELDREGDCLGYYSREKEQRIKAFMGCPLEEGAGALCLDSKRSNSFGTKDQKILHQFAQLIQQLRDDIDNTRSSQQEMGFYACLQTLHFLRMRYQRWSEYLGAFLHTLSQYTSFTYCFFASRDGKGGGYFLEGANRPILAAHSSGNRKFDINEGIVGWVFRNKTMVSTSKEGDSRTSKRLLSRDAELPALQSVVCLPIVVNMRTRGVLVLADPRGDMLPDGLKGFLQLVAEHFSLFLENLYLRNKLQKSSSPPE